MISPHPASLFCSGEAFYPTPPPSPDLELCSQPCEPLLPPSPPATPTEEFPTTNADKQAPLPPPLHTPAFLNTAHHLPHASTLRLGAGLGILAALGGNRVLQLDLSQSVWDRMPYSAVTAVFPSADATEEDQIEAMLGEDQTESTPPPLLWSARNQK